MIEIILLFTQKHKFGFQLNYDHIALLQIEGIYILLIQKQALFYKKPCQARIKLTLKDQINTSCIGI
jgi:hypothetical protein